MKPWHIKRSLYSHAIAVILISLSMAFYTIWVGSTRSRTLADALQTKETPPWEPSSARSLAYNKHVQMEATSFVPSPGMTQQRMLALRNRGLSVGEFDANNRQQHNDETAWLFVGIAGSIICSAWIGMHAFDRWIAWEEAERNLSKHEDNRDDSFHIVYSRTTGEIGYEGCDWRSDITNFDV